MSLVNEMIKGLLPENEKRKVVAVSTGTSAAHLSLLVAGIKPGDEVILSSLNFVGVSQAISATGAKPVFCDVNDDDLTIDIQKAEMLINKKTAAIITLDFGSNQCDLDKFIDLKYLDKLRDRFKPLFNGEFETGIEPDEWNWRFGRDPDDVTRQICNAWKSDNFIRSVVCHKVVGESC